jgi:hypothetical protein
MLNLRSGILSDTKSRPYLAELEATVEPGFILRQNRAIMKKKERALLMAMGIVLIVLGETRLGRAWGTTWMGAELERQLTLAGLRFGPFRIRTILNLNNAGYDSNIYFDYGGQHIKDYTLTTGPTFNIYLPLKKRIVFQITESPQYVYFYHTERERVWNNTLGGQIHFVFNRWYFSVGGAYSHARQRWSSEIDIQLRRRTDNIQGMILWQATKRTSFSLNYRRDHYAYDNATFGTFDVRDRLNRVENYLNFASYFQMTLRARMFLNFEYGLFDFERQIASSKNSRSYALYGGFDFAPTGIIRGRLNLGYKYFNVLALHGQDFRGLVGDTQVSIRLLRPLAVRASYSKNVQFSVWYNNAFYLENIVGVGTSLYVLKNIRLDGDVRYGENSYPQNSLSAPGGVQDRLDHYRTYSVGVYYRVKRNVALGVSAGRWIRHSNDKRYNYNRDFVGLNLTYDF